MTEENILDVIDWYETGKQWAKSLNAGSVFLGTSGEARNRGLDGMAAMVFSLGAISALPNAIYMAADSNIIASVERSN